MTRIPTERPRLLPSPRRLALLLLALAGPGAPTLAEEEPPDRLAAALDDLHRDATAAVALAKAQHAAADASLRVSNAALEGARRDRSAAGTQVASEAVQVAEEDRRDADRFVALATKRLADHEAFAARISRASARTPGRGSFALPVEGQVSRISADGKPVTDLATPLRPGETVTTGIGGAARLLLGGGDVDLSLGAGSVIVLLEDADEAIEAALRTGSGRVKKFLETKLKKKFEVRTPSAALAVRGTAYDLEVREGQEVLTVTEGVVEVRPVGGGAPVLVRAGERLTFGGKGPWQGPAPFPPLTPGEGAR